MTPPPDFDPKLPGMPSKSSGLFGGDKKNPYKGHLARPKEVPLAKPEYTESEKLGMSQVIAPSVPAQPQPVQQANPNALPAEHPYSFIVNEMPKRSTDSVNSGRDSSLIKRIGVVAGGLVLLIVLFSVFKNLVLPGPNLSGVVATFQRQQAILHVTSEALQQTSLSADNKNFAVTAQLSLTSSAHSIGGYLTENGEKLTPQIINAKISSDIDSQLTAAASNNQYNSTFSQVMQTLLTGYMNGLKTAIAEDKGAKGQQLLRDDYSQAQLLLTALSSPSS